MTHPAHQSRPKITYSDLLTKLRAYADSLDYAQSASPALAVKRCGTIADALKQLVETLEGNGIAD